MSACAGTCNDINKWTCSKPFLVGKCPGASNVRCCTGTVSLKPGPPPPPPVLSSRPPSNKRPAFVKAASCYPQGTGPEVKLRLGGGVNADYITNTCAVRLSHMLNCLGFNLGTSPNYVTVRDKNRRNILLRVRELYPLVNQLLGKPDVVVTLPRGKRGVDVSAFRGKKGIIRFDTTGAWNDASGHFDLWDGNRMVEASHADDATTERYFGLSVAIQLWTLP